MAENIVDILCRRSKNKPDGKLFTHIVDGEDQEESLTAGELDRKARRVGALLQKLIKDRQPVILIYPMGLENIVGLIGCLYGGQIVVQVNVPDANEASIKKLNGIIEDSGASTILTLVDVMENIKEYIKSDDLLSQMTWVITDKLPESLEEEWKPVDVDFDDPVILQYTSGSTSEPKGVMTSYRNIIAIAEMIIEYDHIMSEESVILMWVPFVHNMGMIIGILVQIYRGNHYVFMQPGHFLQKPIRWLKAIQKYKAVNTVAPNFSFDLCTKLITEKQKESLDLSSLQVVSSGSEPIRIEAFNGFADAFKKCGLRREILAAGYGLTEATVLVSSNYYPDGLRYLSLDAKALQDNEVRLVADDDINCVKYVSNGTKHGDEEVCIVSTDTFEKLPDLTIGEIWVAGSNVSKGYWKNEEKTKETFGFKISNDTRDYLRTGDLGFLYNGDLFITGRIKDLLVIRGKNHYPQDLEWTAGCCHPDLNQKWGAAFSVEKNQQEVAVILYEIKEDRMNEANPQEIVNVIRKEISKKHQLELDAVYLLNPGMLPKTRNNKVTRSKGKELYLEQKLSVYYKWEKDEV
ncbi:acyl-CoA synthetase (AMP-forming)/AMP-acid ligase II [Ruminiclostridium sufflavum DSM 19573]|uniref:Acyl-CoA synthetase (AMP-forming)/AMP-acid ligase II n=1 Tax=Ruminiclostridium sufflavum DSM 19573 TaxID=1121337 RepID=A0A318XKA5_9FIRM|nr:fatty acyl-AMP ligase [Ruminiclostridium sufflavum]PYG84956.1 acyl-CoA synthetase (AMP-forming)/AMP-acid ligase II [Ruminiclostridium sufflavum DSM 19573]